MYRDHILWNFSKKNSRPKLKAYARADPMEFFEKKIHDRSLRLMHGLTPTWAIWWNGNTPKIRVE